MKHKSIIRRSGWIVLTLFCLLNLIAFLHAYKFTHFDKVGAVKTKDNRQLSFGQKLKILFTGVNNPRPQNTKLPDQPFETITLQSNKAIECWWIPISSSKGSVILFHGYGGEKSSMLDKAAIFREMGYNTLLVDFMGVGGSEGNQTTIGYYEAEQVKTGYDFLINKGERNIVLFGTSLGAVAIMKAQKDYDLKSISLILECPFGSMLKTVKARFASMKVPSFPMANLLVFWGGLQNGFNAFAHNPVEYARGINVPTLLLYGEKDEKVSVNEIGDIFRNLKGSKKLIRFPLAGHENYLNKYRAKWEKNIRSFLRVEK